MSTAVAKQVPFSVAISGDQYQGMIKRALTDPKDQQRFIASITSAVAATPALQACTPQTILSSALVGHSLNLSPSPQLGQFYFLPFRDTKNGVTNAVPCIGYKGYIQLALRTGAYKKLNVIPIKKGEFISYNPLTEDINVKMIEDPTEREMAETVGYYAFFEYLNGFTKSMYWTKEKVEIHGKRYSKAYSKPDSFWQRDFDAMGCKTLIRQLISHWGVMSIELQSAMDNDGDFSDALEAEEYEVLEPETAPEPTQEPEKKAKESKAIDSFDDIL